MEVATRAVDCPQDQEWQNVADPLCPGVEAETKELRQIQLLVLKRPPTREDPPDQEPHYRLPPLDANQALGPDCRQAVWVPVHTM